MILLQETPETPESPESPEPDETSETPAEGPSSSVGVSDAAEISVVDPDE